MLLWPRFPGSMSTPHVGELCQTQTQIGGPWFVRLGKSSARACFRSAPPRIKFAVSATTRNNLRVARDRRRHLADMAFWLPEFSKVHNVSGNLWQVKRVRRLRKRVLSKYAP